MARSGEERWEPLWRDWLERGRPPRQFLHTLLRRLFGMVPGSPRCKLCGRPFGGLGRPLVLVGLGPSRKNPQFCTFCFEGLPPGGVEVDVAVLFADVRGATGIAERMAPKEFASLLARFYAAANQVLLRHGAVIDKLVGDAVMALFIPGIAGRDYRARSVKAALALQASVGDERLERRLAVGVGIHAGAAFVGNVGAEGVSDFTALGDTVNVAARLQSNATAGEVIVSESVYQSVREGHADAEGRVVVLRGRDEPLAVRVLRASSSSSSATRSG